MCRLLYLPPNCKVDQGDLQELLEYLEVQCGGHGNGFGAAKTGKQTVVYKGLNVHCDKIAAQMVAYSGRGYNCVFHTRLVSCGDKSDANCHPFQAHKTLICHNGHDATLAGLAHYRDNGECDSRVFASMYQRRGSKWMIAKGYYPPSGVWFIVSGRHQIVNIKGGFCDMEYNETMGIWASQFPYKHPWLDSYNVAEGMHDMLCGDGTPKEANYSQGSWNLNNLNPKGETDPLPVNLQPATSTSSSYGEFSPHEVDTNNYDYPTGTELDLEIDSRKADRLDGSKSSKHHICSTAVELCEAQARSVESLAHKVKGKAKRKSRMGFVESDSSTLLVPENMTFEEHNNKRRKEIIKSATPIYEAFMEKHKKEKADRKRYKNRVRNPKGGLGK